MVIVVNSCSNCGSIGVVVVVVVVPVMSWMVVLIVWIKEERERQTDRHRGAHIDQAISRIVGL